MHSVIRSFKLAMTCSHVALLKFWCTLWRIGVHIFLTIFLEKESRTLRSAERGDYTKSLLFDMIPQLNIFSSFLMVSFAMWCVAPSCWNLCDSKCRSCWPCNKAYKESNIFRYRSCVIATVVYVFQTTVD